MALSPRRLFLVAIETVGVFLCPLLSLTVMDTTIEIKLYFSPWSLLEGRVYPRECHLPETTEVLLATWTHATYLQDDEKWSGKSRYQMRGITKQGLQGEKAQVCVPRLSPQPQHALPRLSAPRHWEHGISTVPRRKGKDGVPMPCSPYARWCMSQCHRAAGQWQPSSTWLLIVTSSPVPARHPRGEAADRESHMSGKTGAAKDLPASLLIYRHGWPLDVPCGTSPTSPDTL